MILNSIVYICALQRGVCVGACGYIHVKSRQHGILLACHPRFFWIIISWETVSWGRSLSLFLVKNNCINRSLIKASCAAYASLYLEKFATASSGTPLIHARYIIVHVTNIIESERPDSIAFAGFYQLTPRPRRWLCENEETSQNARCWGTLRSGRFAQIWQARRTITCAESATKIYRLLECSTRVRLHMQRTWETRTWSRVLWFSSLLQYLQRSCNKLHRILLIYELSGLNWLHKK